ncbi:hypothetical protein Zm00014a_020323 [Zea mays]|uniref:Uncharacterized protein n=1 Tax=Zea mays TaxID=4577 RepID=A0A3L6F3S6_MAIZE|nr:hypothetical protein Zm00014a_020323 [Zea mays]
MSLHTRPIYLEKKTPSPSPLPVTGMEFLPYLTPTGIGDPTRFPYLTCTT